MTCIYYVIMKTMCPSCYHCNDFAVTHALGQMRYGCHKTITYHVLKCLSRDEAIVMITERANCFHDHIYITTIIEQSVCCGSHLRLYLYYIYYTYITTYIYLFYLSAYLSTSLFIYL